MDEARTKIETAALRNLGTIQLRDLHRETPARVLAFQRQQSPTAYRIPVAKVDVILRARERDAGEETPIKSADSRRVDTEDRRRWWELRFVPPIELRVGESGGESAAVAETGVGRERDMETEPLREWEREWR